MQRVTCGCAPCKASWLLFAALVGCGHVSGLLVREAPPAECSARIGSQTIARTWKKCVDPSVFSRSRSDRICIRRHALANWCCRSSCWPASCHQQQLRLLVSLAPNYDCPGHPRDLVGERDCRHFGWSTFHSNGRAMAPVGSVLARVADDGHCADDQQPPRISRLPCLVMPPSLSLPAGVCLFGTNPIQAARLRPDEKVFQLRRIATSARAADAWDDSGQPAARLTTARCRAMMCSLSMDAISVRHTPCCRAAGLRECRDAESRLSALSATILRLSRVHIALPLADTMPSSARWPRRALLHCGALGVPQLPGSVQHQGGSCSFVSDPDVPDRRPRHRLASPRAPEVADFAISKTRPLSTDGSPQCGRARRNHPMISRCRRVGAVHSINRSSREDDNEAKRSLLASRWPSAAGWNSPPEGRELDFLIQHHGLQLSPPAWIVVGDRTS